MNKLYLSIFIFIAFSNKLLAVGPTGAPPSLAADVNLTACNCTSFATFGEPFSSLGFFDTNAQVIAAFNFARRNEEMVFGLAANSLGNLVLPNNYSTLSDSQKGLIILNSERTARAGIDYDGAGAKAPVMGLPFQGVDAALNNLSLAQANFMQVNNTLDHNGPGGDTFQRLNAQFGTQPEFLARGENLYGACGGFDTHLVEQAIFGWLYQDAGSAWGHRAAIFIQDWDPIVAQPTPNGFKNNYGPAGSEGFIGFGVIKNVSYPLLCGTGGRLSAELPNLRKNAINQPLFSGHIVVMMVIDPSTTFQASPLPVDLVSFNLKKLGENNVKLIWETAYEKSNLGFDIEKSIDGKLFKKIGFLEGNLNTIERQTYTYLDKISENGIYYYRLKQYDLNGKTSYSPIKSIDIKGIESDLVKIWPNPTKDYIEIESSQANNYELFDSMGKLIMHGKIDESSKQIPLKNIPAGFYFVNIRTSQGNQIKKLVVQ